MAITYAYQWQRSADPAFTGAVNISPATLSLYTAQSADIGSYLRCVVTATNAAGSASDNSNIVGPITVLGVLGAGLGHVYAITINGSGVSGALDLFTITPADDHTCHIVGCYLSQSSDAGSAEEEMLRVELIRGHTVTGSGGLPVTPVPMNSSDGEASFTARTLDTTIASDGTPVVLHAEAFNIRTGWRYEPNESERPGVKETNTTLVVRLMAAPIDPVTVSATLLVEEF